MKVKLRATVTYEWDEDSSFWPDVKDPTPEKILDAVREYVDGDVFYVLDNDVKGYAIEIAEKYDD